MRVFHRRVRGTRAGRARCVGVTALGFSSHTHGAPRPFPSLPVQPQSRPPDKARTFHRPPPPRLGESSHGNSSRRCSPPPSSGVPLLSPRRQTRLFSAFSLPHTAGNAASSNSIATKFTGAKPVVKPGDEPSLTALFDGAARNHSWETATRRVWERGTPNPPTPAVRVLEVEDEGYSFLVVTRD